MCIERERKKTSRWRYLDTEGIHGITCTDCISRVEVIPKKRPNLTVLNCTPPPPPPATAGGFRKTFQAVSSLSVLVGVVKKKKEEGEATAHPCILRCLTQLAPRSGNPTHALNMLRSFEVIAPYLYFLVSLFVSPSTHLGWLFLCQTVDHNRMSMAFRTMRTTVVSDVVSLLVKLGYTQKSV